MTGSSGAADVLTSAGFLTVSVAGRKLNKPTVDSPGVEESPTVVTCDVVVSAFGLSAPNLNPPTDSSAFFTGSMELPNLKPAVSVFWLDSIEAPNLNPPGSFSVFLAGSMVEPNLNPEVSLGVSIAVPNLKPEETSSFLLAPAIPNDNSLFSAGLSANTLDESIPNFGPVSAVPAWTPNLKLETDDGVTAGLTPGLGSSHDLQRTSLSGFLTIHTGHSHWLAVILN